MQQRRGSPLVQREPLPQYKSSDAVRELRPLVRPGDDSWRLTVEGDYSPDSVGRLIWPRRPTIPPPGVTIKMIAAWEYEGSFGGGKKPLTMQTQERTFEISGVAPFTLEGMDPSIRTMFEDQGLGYESKETGEAREKFRKSHAKLGLVVLDNIDDALKRVTRNNPGLLLEFYRAYKDWRITDDIDASRGVAGNTDRGVKHPGGYTDFNAGVLRLRDVPKLPTDDPVSLLATTLIHELVHTAHANDYFKGPGEGKAYGIENYFNERLGDEKRDEETLKVGPKMGDKPAMDASYHVMKLLYQIIDTGVSDSPHLKGVARQKARDMSVEFITKNRNDFSKELREFIIAEVGKAGLDSLPSQEKN